MGFNFDNNSTHRDRDDCRGVVKKNVEVRTPVVMDVNVEIGNVGIVCSTPQITNCSSSFDYKSTTRCKFTINQLITVEIPICYHVQTDVGCSYVDCDVDGDSNECNEHRW